MSWFWFSVRLNKVLLYTLTTFSSCVYQFMRHLGWFHLLGTALWYVSLLCKSIFISLLSHYMFRKVISGSGAVQFFIILRNLSTVIFIVASLAYFFCQPWMGYSPPCQHVFVTVLLVLSHSAHGTLRSQKRYCIISEMAKVVEHFIFKYLVTVIFKNMYVSWLLLLYYVYEFCLCVCLNCVHAVPLSLETRGRWWVPWDCSHRQLWAALWVLHTAHGSSGTTASALRMSIWY